MLKYCLDNINGPHFWFISHIFVSFVKWYIGTLLICRMLCGYISFSDCCGLKGISATSRNAGLLPGGMLDKSENF